MLKENQRSGDGDFLCGQRSENPANNPVLAGLALCVLSGAYVDIRFPDALHLTAAPIAVHYLGSALFPFNAEIVAEFRERMKYHVIPPLISKISGLDREN
jgi:hypothetical protein